MVYIIIILLAALAASVMVNVYLRNEILDERRRAYEAVESLKTDLKDCRNELCLRCGQYKQRHLGACDGCRWRADNG